MLRIVLCLSALVSCSLAGVKPPRFRYDTYSAPTGQTAQFYSGADDSFIYNWGYHFPGRAHFESKTHDGVVKGSYTFEDANGAVQQAMYTAGPSSGFTVELKEAGGSSGLGPVVFTVPEPSPVVPAAVVPQPQAFVAPQPNIPNHLFKQLAKNAVPLDIGSEKVIAKASPYVLRAVRSGQLTPILGYPDQIVFRVDNELVDEARGSVSALAALLDIDTVSPRHDAQVYRGPSPTIYTANSQGDGEEFSRGILDIESFTDGPGYIVRIPY